MFLTAVIERDQHVIVARSYTTTDFDAKISLIRTLPKTRHTKEERTPAGVSQPGREASKSPVSPIAKVLRGAKEYHVTVVHVP